MSHAFLQGGGGIFWEGQTKRDGRAANSQGTGGRSTPPEQHGIVRSMTHPPLESTRVAVTRPSLSTVIWCMSSSRAPSEFVRQPLPQCSGHDMSRGYTASVVLLLLPDAPMCTECFTVQTAKQ